MKLDALIAFTQASYRNMKWYFTSQLIEHNRIRILKTCLLFQLLRRVSSLSNCMLFASPLKFCLCRFFNILTSEAPFSALQFVFQVGRHSVFVDLQYELVMAYLLSCENKHELCSFCRFSDIIIRGPNRFNKDRHL